jgi:hypothetical protein
LRAALVDIGKGYAVLVAAAKARTALPDATVQSMLERAQAAHGMSMPANCP